MFFVVWGGFFQDWTGPYWLNSGGLLAVYSSSDKQLPQIYLRTSRAMCCGASLSCGCFSCFLGATYRFERVNFPRALPCGYARGAGCWAQALSPNALLASRSRFLGSALNQNGRSMGHPKSRHTFCFERCYTWSTSVEPSCKLLSVLPRTRLGAVTSKVVMQARHQTTPSPPTWSTTTSSSATTSPSTTRQVKSHISNFNLMRFINNK